MDYGLTYMFRAQVVVQISGISQLGRFDQSSLLFLAGQKQRPSSLPVGGTCSLLCRPKLTICCKQYSDIALPLRRRPASSALTELRELAASKTLSVPCVFVLLACFHVLTGSTTFVRRHFGSKLLNSTVPSEFNCSSCCSARLRLPLPSPLS